MMSFSSTINKVMLIRKEQSINTFSISCEDFDFDEYELETFISSAIQCNVQNLSLDFVLLGRVPQCLFTSKTLVHLSLNYCCIGIPSIGDVSLPSLNYLCLCSIEYESDEALPHLLSGCPVLKELSVESIINARRLGYLGISECWYDQISLSPMPSLTEAHIRFHIYASGRDCYVYSRAVLKLIDSLCNVKCLKLFGTIDELHDLGVAGMYVRFGNLIRLELAADWRFIPKFLECANNLEVIIINKVTMKLQNWMEPNKKRCACLLSSLRTVTIFEFGCTEQ
ncbi:hypothetical protein CASFOL_004743 [Castilleja foliolosa]|uniref:F-box/LRR-repeat protein 15/At3g58940/PEG3-like LRR domain-containing protein n=1 Tax=Castilleja foliolosa TaxID=1961234 RepID=A0ABD3EBI1_9LAMI